MCLVALLMIAAPVQAQSTRYAGRLLADVLRELQVSGLKIVFSSSLVRPDARVLAEPRARAPRRILDEILRPHGLEAQAGDAGRLLIVRSARSGGRRQATEAAAAPVETGSIAGRVVDANTGAPVPDVVVMVQATGHSTQTDEQGAFELSEVPAGRHDLFVSTIGYSLARPAVEVSRGATTTLTIPLAEGTGAYTDRVIVTADTVPVADQAIPARQVLGSAALQRVGTVLIDDPFRAVQALPGVISNDDFRSDFSVRGIDFNHLGLSIDGIQTRVLLHAAEAVDDGGSMALLNSDILDRVTLSSGAYPQRFGDRSGAWLEATMREGSRAARGFRGAVSGTAASMLAEGPLGRSAKGSWLASTRYSYIDWLVRRVVSDVDAVFGFGDLQSKVVYDVTPRQRVEVMGIAGRARLDQPQERQPNEAADAADDMALGSVAWRSTIGPSVVLSQRFAVGGHRFRNVNPQAVEIGRGTFRDLSFRSDALWVPRPAITIETGGQAQHLRSSRSLLEYNATPLGTVVATRTDDFDESARVTSGFVHSSFAAGRFTIAPGLRVAHSSIVDETVASPWLQAGWALTDALGVRAGIGVYHQFPDFREVYGSNAGVNLRPERARHIDLALEHRLGARTRWQTTLFHRREANVLHLPDAFRLIAGRPVPPPPFAQYENRLDGHAHGVELFVQRELAQGLSGWASYAWSHTTRRDRATGERFDADFDQRHTANVYGHYAISSRTSVSGKLLVGSNFPMPGYWDQRGELLFVGDRRNAVRLPGYARLDIRANHVFNYTKRRLTLFVEVMNVLDRSNVRWTAPGVALRTGQAFDYLQELFPLLPSAGMLLEF
ncbi:MAG TPA: TonB-dependent receptor [Vicinamibacterales bacterium]